MEDGGCGEGPKLEVCSALLVFFFLAELIICFLMFQYLINSLAIYLVFLSGSKLRAFYSM